jgi:hypothetical protein
VAAKLHRFEFFGAHSRKTRSLEKASKKRCLALAPTTDEQVSTAEEPQSRPR